MREVRKATDISSEFKEAVTESLQQPNALLGGVIQHLEPHGKKFQVFPAASAEEMHNLEANPEKIDAGLHSGTKTAEAEKSKQFSYFFQGHSTVSQYAFCVLKCHKKNCPYPKEPRLPPLIFNDLHPIPDLTLSEDLIHYRAFEEV